MRATREVVLDVARTIRIAVGPTTGIAQAGPPTMVDQPQPDWVEVGSGNRKQRRTNAALARRESRRR